MKTALGSLSRAARLRLQEVRPLRPLRGCGQYGVDPGIHNPPATDLAGGRSPNVVGDHVEVDLRCSLTFGRVSRGKLAR